MSAEGPMESLIDQARAVARTAIGKLDKAQQVEVLVRLQGEELHGLVVPRVCIAINLSQSQWSLATSVGGKVPMRVAEASGKW